MSINAVCPSCLCRSLDHRETICPKCKTRLPTVGERKFRVKVRLAGGQGAVRWLTKTVIGLSLAKRVETNFKARAVEADTFGIINSPTLAEAWKQYHDSAKGSKRSLSDDCQRFRFWIAPRIGDVKLDRITPAMIEDIFQTMESKGRAKATQARIFALLSVMFNFAIRRGLCKDNPCKRTNKPRGENIRTRVLDANEIERFLATLTDWPNRSAALLLRFLLFTGIRRGQARQTRWNWINWEFRTVSYPADTTKNANPLIS